MISSAFPYKKQRRRVLGREMAYVNVGKGDPIVLLHGNPTSSYLWRNVLPHVQPLGRCVAPDLIGMGDSDKLPDSGPGSYCFVEHRRYLDALLEALDVHSRVTFVVHDWGSALGFDWANRHRGALKGIAFMEAIVAPQGRDHWDKMGMRPALESLRSQAPERFFSEHGFAPTTTYELAWEKRCYPPKGILGTAYEFATGRRLSSSDFEGGKTGAVKVLRQMGFTVREK
jgi:haloalkane dehalogenase